MHRNDHILFVFLVFILDGVIGVIRIMVGIVHEIDFSRWLLADEVAFDHLLVSHGLDFSRLIHRRFDLISQRMTLGLVQLRVDVS